MSSTDPTANHKKESSEAVPSVEKGSIASSTGNGEGPHSIDLSLERRVWRKMDLFILPVASMMTFLQALDRTNIGNARVAGFQNLLHMTNNQYSIALTITLVPHILAELPSNLLLRTIGGNLALPTMVTVWGVVTMCQGFVHNYSGLVVCRLFLGMAEGGLFPGLVLYLSGFYPRERLHLRLGIFLTASALAGAFSGLMAFGILNMDGLGGRAGWAWIFILEGLFTVLFGICSYFILPRNPETARFLSSVEKEYVAEQLKARGASAGIRHEDDILSWKRIFQSFKEAFKAPQVLLIPVMFFPAGAALTGLAYFTPSIVQTFGYSPTHTQLMSVPPFAVAFAVSLPVTWLSDRYHSRGLATIAMTLFCIIGFAMFLGSTNPHVQYGSLFFSVTGVYGAASAICAWTANNVAPHLRRAIAIAIGFITFNSGGILAQWLLAGTLSPPPRYTKATIILLVLEIVSLIAAVTNLLYLNNQNKKKAVRRKHGSRDDEDPTLGDKSAWFTYSL